MRTTVNVPDALINDLVIETGERNKTRLIRIALEDMLRAIKRKKLINLSGKMELLFHLDNWIEFNYISRTK